MKIPLKCKCLDESKTLPLCMWTKGPRILLLPLFLSPTALHFSLHCSVFHRLCAVNASATAYLSIPPFTKSDCLAVGSAFTPPEASPRNLFLWSVPQRILPMKWTI